MIRKKLILYPFASFEEVVAALKRDEGIETDEAEVQKVAEKERLISLEQRCEALKREYEQKRPDEVRRLYPGGQILVCNIPYRRKGVGVSASKSPPEPYDGNSRNPKRTDFILRFQAVVDAYSGYALGGIFIGNNTNRLLQELEKLVRVDSLLFHAQGAKAEKSYYPGYRVHLGAKSLLSEFTQIKKAATKGAEAIWKQELGFKEKTDALWNHAMKLSAEYNQKPILRKGHYGVIPAELVTEPAPERVIPQGVDVWRTFDGFVYQASGQLDAFYLWPDEHGPAKIKAKFNYQGLVTDTEQRFHTQVGRIWPRVSPFPADKVGYYWFRPSEPMPKVPLEMDLGGYLTPISSWEEAVMRVIWYAKWENIAHLVPESIVAALKSPPELEEKYVEMFMEGSPIATGFGYADHGFQEERKNLAVQLRIFQAVADTLISRKALFDLLLKLVAASGIEGKHHIKFLR